MNDQEIKDLIGKVLLKEKLDSLGSQEKALVIVYERLSWDIFVSITDLDYGFPKTEAIWKINMAMGRLCHFGGYQQSNNKKINIPERLVADLFFIYERWIWTFKYLAKNYYDLPSNEFHRKWSQKQVSNFYSLIKRIFKKHQKQAETLAGVSIYPDDITLMLETFSAAAMAILDDDVFIVYKTEMGHALQILKPYLRLLVLPTGKWVM